MTLRISVGVQVTLFTWAHYWLIILNTGMEQQKRHSSSMAIATYLTFPLATCINLPKGYRLLRCMSSNAGSTFRPAFFAHLTHVRTLQISARSMTGAKFLTNRHCQFAQAIWYISRSLSDHKGITCHSVNSEFLWGSVLKAITIVKINITSCAMLSL